MPSKLLGNLKHGLALIISAPAGTGKTTLVQMLQKEFPSVVNSISCTTRKPRDGEVPGKDYYFLSKDEFESKIAAGEFLEYVELYGHYYGTSREKVIEQQRQGKHVILTIDTQGALYLKGKFPGVYIFIAPPSLEELHNRMVKRKTESMEMIEKESRGPKKK